eukprot:jgi/Hompol1/4940/HPOL_000460-RA
MVRLFACGSQPARSHQTCDVPETTLQEFKVCFEAPASASASASTPTQYSAASALKCLADNHLARAAEIAEELPESTPRFIVISYEMKHRDGRVSYPLGSSTNNRMIYASTGSYLFQKAEITGKVFDLTDAEEFTDDWIIEKLEKSLTRP